MIKVVAGWPAKQQKGIASFIVVFVIVVLISLVSLGFARLMDRALRDVTSNQLGAAAEYAAQSGLNDAITYVRQNPTANVTDCDALTTTGTTFYNFFKQPADKTILTTDGNTKYTCLLINPTPGDLAFQNLPPYNSQVVKLEGSGGQQLQNVMFSWQAANNNPAKNPFNSGTQFLTENAWGTGNRPPVLKVTLYPIISGGDLTAVQNASRTYYLYPNTSGGTTAYSAPSGSIIGGNCGNPPVSGFTSTYQCNVVISGLTSAPYWEARITPLYLAADVGIKATNSAGKVSFINAQSVIDVTGKSNEAVRRIQARVATGGASEVNAGNNSIPEDAIRSAATICKRLIVPTDASLILYADPASVANSPLCVFLSSTLSPLTVDLSASPTAVTAGGITNLTWRITSGTATSCTATSTPNVSNWNGGKPVPPTGGSLNQNTDPLNTTTTYTFRLNCTNPAGQTGTDDAQVTVSPVPPPPPPPPGPTPPPPPGPTPPPPPSSGCSGSSQSGSSNSGIPDPCVRDFYFIEWVGSGRATFGYWASHCYDILTIAGQWVPWPRTPDDNSQLTSYTVNFPDSGGTATIVCDGDGTSERSISVPSNGGSSPPPGPTPPPSPSGHGDPTCYDDGGAIYAYHRGCTSLEQSFGFTTRIDCYDDGHNWIKAGSC